jgi:gamma-glutamyltranspeptidase/glutathione hydrolase
MSPLRSATAPAAGGLITAEDLARWKVHIEEPMMTTYKGIEVYKLAQWTQGPALLQALNIVEQMDVKSMGYSSARYVHAIYQAMSLAFADRDFYYGDPYFPPDEPMRGLLSKEYARARLGEIGWDANDPRVKPGDPYPFQGGTNRYRALLDRWGSALPDSTAWSDDERRAFDRSFRAGTTSIEAVDEHGWVVSVTPSGGWNPAFIAGRTGIGLSQRSRSFRSPSRAATPRTRTCSSSS